MDIVITITGGWTGLRLTSVIDVDALSKDAAEAVFEALSACMDHRSVPDDRSRDARTIRIDASGRTASFQENRAPDAWRVMAAAMPPGRTH